MQSVDIKDISGNIRFSTPVNEGSKRKFQLMKEDYITLKFSLANPIYFQLGDGIDNELGMFELVDLYKPVYNTTTGAYDYELQLDAYYWKWKHKKFFYTPETTGREASWNLTAPLGTHLNVFLGNLKALGYKFREEEFTFDIDGTVANTSKFVSYDNANLIDALTLMAETWECEWWITDHVIHFGKCEFGDPVDFIFGDNVNSMPRSDSQLNYATRIYAFGSTRNIPKTYRKKLVFNVDKVNGRDISDSSRVLKTDYFPIKDVNSEEYRIEINRGSGIYKIDNREWTESILISEKLSGGNYKITGDQLKFKTGIALGIIIPGPLYHGDYSHKASFIYSYNGVEKEISIGSQTVTLGKDQQSNLTVVFDLPNELTIEKGASNLRIRTYLRIPSFSTGSIRVSISSSIEGALELKKGSSAKMSVTFLTGTNSGRSFQAVYNPDLLIGSEINITRLPEGVTASLGDMYTIDNIIKGKVPDNYFSKDDKELTLNGVVQKRLMLPEGIPYVDAYRYSPTGERIDIGDERYDNPVNMEMPVEEAVEEIVIFEDEYAKHTGSTDEVPEPGIGKELDEDKNPTGNEYPIYTFKDTGLKNLTGDFRLDELRLIFQTGKLAGLDFALNLKESDDTGTAFEIVRNEDYGRYLPDDTLYPQPARVENGKEIPADTYVLYGFDTAFLSEDMLPDAEKELLLTSQKYIKKTMVDPSTYNCAMASDAVYDKDGNHRFFEVGDRVNLINKGYFENGRQSRIIGFEYNLDIPYDSPAYMVGETAPYSRIGEIESKIDSLTYKGQTYSGSTSVSGGASVYVIGVNDNTVPSDRNVFSAKRSRNEFLNKNERDRAKKKIIFEEGIDVGVFETGERGGKIDGKGNAELLTLVVRELLRTPKFVDGLWGEGWQLWMEDTLSYLTIDKLTVRQVMVALEMLIEKARSVGGQLCVSAANGKIKTATLEDRYWRITFEQDNSFRAHDLVRCATFSGGALQNYWVEVTREEGNSILIAEEEFNTSLPVPGDECVLMGNTQDMLRQNLILISATEDGQPRLDVIDGVKSKSFSGCLRTRLGNLDGISDEWFPADNQPHGDGLYADNAYLRGTFLLVTGEDIKTKFEVVEGEIISSVTALRNDFASGYLNNPAFDNGLMKWNTENETVFFLLGNRWIWVNNNVLSQKGDSASVTQDNGRMVVRIRNKYILQKRANLKSVPSFPENGEYPKEAVPVYLTFFYRCVKAGTLRVKFENVDKTGFADFNSLEVTEEVAETDGYIQYTCNGFWNGTGDFKLSFTGDIYLYMLILSTDKVESLAYRYKTLFEQSERLVKISAAVYDKDENALRETGLMIQPEGTGIYVKDVNGKLALIGVGVEETDSEGNSKTVIKLAADNIKLEGLVTANGYFKVREDGSIESVNGTFRGNVYAEDGTIGGFRISQGHIGGADVIHKDDGQIEVKESEDGLFLYNDMIGFNDKGRQAIFGTWNNLGQPMLCRLVDTAMSYNFEFGLSPKYGILFDIRNSINGNFAFAGRGAGMLNGTMDGYSYEKIVLHTANAVFADYMDLQKANRFLVKATKGSTVVALPKIGQVRKGLGIGTSTPFCTRVTVVADLGSDYFHVCGRWWREGNSGKYPWNTEEFPVMVHWDGDCYETLEMGKGDTLEVLLVYDPESTETLNGWPTKYTARIINKLS